MPQKAKKVSIRAAKQTDIGELGEIWIELMQMHQKVDDGFKIAKDGLQYWTEMALEMLNRDDGFILVAELDKRQVGFCLGWIAHNPLIYELKKLGFISEVAVKQSYRRSGIGSSLMEGARRWFFEHGLKEFHLSTAVWNEDAQKFWQALGGKPFLLRFRFSVNQ